MPRGRRPPGCGAAFHGGRGRERQAVTLSSEATVGRTGEGVKPLNVIQTPTENSQAAIGRVRKNATVETWSITPKTVAMNAANSRGAPIRPTVGMIRGTSRER